MIPIFMYLSCRKCQAVWLCDCAQLLSGFLRGLVQTFWCAEMLNGKPCGSSARIPPPRSIGNRAVWYKRALWAAFSERSVKQLEGEYAETVMFGFDCLDDSLIASGIRRT